jgi:hypothetical protein
VCRIKKLKKAAKAQQKGCRTIVNKKGEVHVLNYALCQEGPMRVKLCVSQLRIEQGDGENIFTQQTEFEEVSSRGIGFNE